ncbi:hypothetical protein LTR37_016680 [Vermiconidia calcicola]|uniref:Uncharacterized protein n=1 Tax=Vermiconidia calcicola TaxID=1690605 RepID=A0ACC3MMW8_9PEZI|nr:hypothetical protein LTR37_016680 [Vermiconidia calcicola]
MLDHNSNLEVCIRRFGSETPYTEYEAPPGSPLHTGSSRERYIEAIANERFEIVTVLRPQFTFKKHIHIKVDTEIDNGALWVTDYLKSSSKKRGKPLETYLDATNILSDGTWKTLGFTFGELYQNEDCDQSRSEAAEEASKRGKIEVSFQRGKVTERKVGANEEWVDFPNLSMETSKRVAIDHGKSHGLQPLDLGTGEPPETWQDWEPAKGKAGEEVTFTFFYTSRMILELKKILPTTTLATPKPCARSMPLVDAALASVGKKRNQPQKYIEITDDKDDEEPLPNKKIKTEPAEPHRTNVIVLDDELSTSKETKTEPGTASLPTQRDNSGLLTTIATTSRTKQTSKEKEKARILLQLDEIKLERRLMELEEEG